jgi:hypothetical protein
MDEIDWFFKPANSAWKGGDGLSTLFVLRRDIDMCFGINPNTGEPFDLIDAATGGKIMVQAIWPGTMAVLAGIDLLGKFLAGSDKGGDVGKRFVAFAERFMALSPADAEVIHQLRNALLHSFGLRWEANGVLYEFVLTRGAAALLANLGERWQVDVEQLRQRFETAATEYEALLRDETHESHVVLLSGFLEMLPKYSKPIVVG